jgi:hypothetical protein
MSEWKPRNNETGTGCSFTVTKWVGDELYVISKEGIPVKAWGCPSRKRFNSFKTAQSYADKMNKSGQTRPQIALR